MAEELKIKITADSSQIKAGMEEATGSVQSAVSTMQGSFSGLDGALGVLKSSWGFLAIGVNQALEILNKAVEIPRKLMAWGEIGAQLTRVEDSFRAVATQAGYSADQIIGSLERASKGTLDASDIMARAGRLMQEGIAPEKMTTLMSLLQRQAPVVGDTMKEAWDKVAESLSMGTTRALRHYVGIIDLDREYQKFAASIGTTKDRLTEQAKQIVLVDVITNRLKESTKGLTGETNKYALEMEKDKVIIKDSWDTIYKSMMGVGGLLTSIYAKTMALGVEWLKMSAGGMILASGAGYEIPGNAPGEGVPGGAAPGGVPGAVVPPKSLIAERTPEQQAALTKMRLETEAEILKLREFERLAIAKKYDAEIAGELDADKRSELRKMKAATLAAYDEKLIKETGEKNAEAAGKAAADREKVWEAEAKANADAWEKGIAEKKKSNEEYDTGRAEHAQKADEVIASAGQARAALLLSLQGKELENQIKDTNQGTELARKYYENRYALGEINAAELARVETELESQRYTIELGLLDRLSGLYMMDLERFQAYQNQKKDAAQGNARQIQGIEHNLAEENKKTWQGLLSPISTAVSTSIQGIIQGTTTLQKALANLFQSILLSFTDKLVHKMIDEWLVGEVTKFNISEAYTALQTALFGAAAVQTVAIKEIESDKIIIKNAYTAASGAASAEASIPYVGPILAVAAAAAMLAMVLGYRSAEGGWDVDRSAMTMLHPQEMVLPANLAEGIRNRVAGGEDRAWKPNNKIFRDIGKLIGEEHGKAISTSIDRRIRKLGYKK